jgi:hypothetical protein
VKFALVAHTLSPAALTMDALSTCPEPTKLFFAGQCFVHFPISHFHLSVRCSRSCPLASHASPHLDSWVWSAYLESTYAIAPLAHFPPSPRGTSPLHCPPRHQQKSSHTLPRHLLKSNEQSLLVKVINVQQRYIACFVFCGVLGSGKAVVKSARRDRFEERWG